MNWELTDNQINFTLILIWSHETLYMVCNLKELTNENDKYIYLHRSNKPYTPS